MHVLNLALSTLILVVGANANEYDLCAASFEAAIPSHRWTGSLPYPDNALDTCWCKTCLASANATPLSCDVFACGAQIRNGQTLFFLLAAPSACSSEAVAGRLIAKVLRLTSPPQIVDNLGHTRAVLIPKPTRWLERYGFSQLGQDVLTILATLGRPGFFVDIGASDGIGLSNTYLLEVLGWDGLCVEPSASFQDLIRSRMCAIDSSIVGSRTGDVVRFYGDGVFAGVTERSQKEASSGSESFVATTHKLEDIFHRHRVPLVVDLLSVDVEGKELDVLEGLPFDDYKIGIVVIEHAYEEPKRARIYEFLLQRGFRLLWRAASQWDDWYVLTELYPHGLDPLLQ